MIDGTSGAIFYGKIKATVPVYVNDAVAYADATLLTGQFYKLTGSRVVYQKP